MQAPTLVFDHINNVVAVVQPADPRIAELDAAQREQVATANGRPA